MSSPNPAERARTRRVVWSVSLAFVLTAGLLIVGAIVLENLARDRVSNYVADRIHAMLGLDPEHPVAVDIGGGSLLLQAMNQRLDEVTATSEDVALGELVGDVRLVATGIPFDTDRPFERVFAEVRVTEDVVSQLATNVTEANVTSVELVEPELKLGTTVTIPRVEVFGFVITEESTVAVGIGLEPFVSEGSIAFMPTSVEFNGNTLSAEAFAELVRGPAQSLLQFGAICVADQLPAVLVLESVEVDGNELVVSLGADDSVFSAEALATKGTC